MKNANKKRGFTIVELVIVIAVVAILAAVLIPTFVGLVDKANVSADEQAVKQMNTVLAADGAVEATDITELFNVLYEAGFTAKNYSPLSNGKFFFWDSGINRVLYVDGDYKVLNTQDSNGYDEKNWISLNGEIKEADINTITIADNTATVKSAEELVTLANAITEGKNTVKGVTNITLKAGDYNFKGAKFELAGDKEITVGTAEGVANFKGMVNLDAVKPNAESNTGTGREYFSAIIGIATKDVTFKNITIENAIVGSETVDMSAVFVGHAQGANVTFDNVKVNNVTVRGLMKVGIFVGQVSGNSTVTIKSNCSVTNSEVQATVGLAGKIFGNAIKHKAANTANVVVEDVKAVAGDTVTVKLVKNAACQYITVDGVEYGRDMEVVDGVLSFADDRSGGYTRYFRTVTDYGFVSANTELDSHKDAATMVLYGYDAQPAKLADGENSATWQYVFE